MYFTFVQENASARIRLQWAMQPVPKVKGVTEDCSEDWSL